MDAPPVQYVKTSDGYDIAYCEAGSGQAMVLGHGSFSHVEYAWRFYAPWYQGLAERFHLVWYDTRSQGLSSYRRHLGYAELATFVQAKAQEPALQIQIGRFRCSVMQRVTRCKLMS